MRLVIQRVTRAKVSVDDAEVSEIGPGMLILVGVENGDTEEDCAWLVRKTLALRIFNDEAGVMNRSVPDIAGEILAVSQFTLLASTAKGNRPSYIRSARPETALPLYEKYCELLEQESVKAGRDDLTVKRGIFGADMKVELLNDGPVTIIIDSKIRE